MADGAASCVAGAENLISAGCHPSSLAGEFDSQLSASFQSYGGFVRLRYTWRYLLLPPRSSDKGGHADTGHQFPTGA